MAKDKDQNPSDTPILISLKELQTEFIERRGMYSENIDHWRLFLSQRLPAPTKEQFTEFAATKDMKE